MSLGAGLTATRNCCYSFACLLLWGRYAVHYGVEYQRYKGVCEQVCRFKTVCFVASCTYIDLATRAYELDCFSTMTFPPLSPMSNPTNLEGWMSV